MDEQNLWYFIKEWMVLPVIGAFAYFIKKYFSRVESAEQRIFQLEIRQAVLDTQISEMKKDIVEIKAGIDKLVAKLIK